MFDFSFAELALVAIVALLVLGPERLPAAARTAGALLRRIRNSWQGVRSEIERELAAEDIKRSIRETAQGVDIRDDVRAAADQIRDAVNPEQEKHAADEQR
ncbi:Sec-independent protein translocase protein TatB [Dokdonella sp.]|uniref:Sec-independent protein translocase protein TatB n=1 Tax=Dokdonella sp. TaxID=2291710 RepID=UPI0035288AB1